MVDHIAAVLRMQGYATHEQHDDHVSLECGLSIRVVDRQFELSIPVGFVPLDGRGPNKRSREVICRSASIEDIVRAVGPGCRRVEDHVRRSAPSLLELRQEVADMPLPSSAIGEIVANVDGLHVWWELLGTRVSLFDDMRGLAFEKYTPDQFCEIRTSRGQFVVRVDESSWTLFGAASFPGDRQRYVFGHGAEVLFTVLFIRPGIEIAEQERLKTEIELALHQRSQRIREMKQIAAAHRQRRAFAGSASDESNARGHEGKVISLRLRRGAQ